MQSEKRTNGVKRSVNKRVSPGLTKVKKSFAISRWLSSKIDIYCGRYRCNRSQAVERGMMLFLSKDINDTIAELQATKIKVAMLEQEIKNSKEIK